MAPLPRAHGDVVAFAKGGQGPVFLHGQGVRGTVFAFSPACHQAVLGNMGVFHSTRLPGPPESASFPRLTAGLFNMNEDRHRQQRRLLQPAFHRKRIEGYHAAMVELTARALDGYREGETRDLVKDMQRLTLAVANKTLFGMDATPGVLSLGEKINEVISLALSPATLLPLALPGTPRQRLVDASARLEADLRALIARKREDGDGADDVLATLLATHDEEGAALTEDELLGQIFILFFAAHDTAKSAICWTLFLLSQHPAVLGDVLDEIRGALRGAPPSPAVLGELPLLERVIKESLRVLPPVPLTVRVTVQPTVLDGVDLPAGTEVILSPYCLHRYPDLYPDPQRFFPARWEAFTPSQFEYAPFGAGPRLCLGSAFAMMEMKTVLAMLLQRFGVAPAPGARIDRRTTIVMAPKHGMPVVLRPAGEVARAGGVRGDVREMVDLPS